MSITSIDGVSAEAIDYLISAAGHFAQQAVQCSRCNGNFIILLSDIIDNGDDTISSSFSFSSISICTCYSPW